MFECDAESNEKNRTPVQESPEPDERGDVEN